MASCDTRSVVLPVEVSHGHSYRCVVRTLGHAGLLAEVVASTDVTADLSPGVSPLAAIEPIFPPNASGIYDPDARRRVSPAR